MTTDGGPAFPRPSNLDDAQEGMTAKKKKDARVGTLWQPVDATPDEIARACLTTPPPKQWEYEKKEAASSPTPTQNA